MPGIDPNIICHKLAINKTCKPIAQKKRNLGTEKMKAALEETKKLLNAGFIKELYFTTWLSNVVMILMHPEDQNKTAFITEHGNFCYKVMPFGLKNAGATYQRLMDKVFQQQIGRNMEIYVDDMVAKTSEQGSHCDDLEEVFQQIRAYNMRLNPEKCAFGVQGGKFLRFMLTSQGIEANPEKCQAILKMNSPKTIKEAQQLAGRIAALSQFLPAVANRSYHFFRTISKNKKFNWTEECERSFTELKQILSSPPILQKPELGKPLYLYLSISNHAVSSVLVSETGKIQNPVYFVSRVLQPAETRYPRIEQLALALILPDFISKLTTEDKQTKHNWKLYVDGAANKDGSGAGVTLKESEQVIAEQSLQFFFTASNNQAKYEALLVGLKLTQDLQITHLTVYCDSLLVVQQIKGEFQVKDPLQEKYWLIAKDLIAKFHKIEIIHVNREQNARADVLSKLATTRPQSHMPTLSQLTLDKPSFEFNSMLSITQEKDWRTPFLEYIKTGIIPTDEQNQKLFRRRASYYTIVRDNLYRRGFSQPLLRCISKDEAETVMAETHEGICGNHIGGRALSAKILRMGYYWPTMKRDCIAKVKKCDNCQKHAMISKTPAKELHTLEVSWPFDRWGLDILGPFPKVPGQVKFLLVSIDYFSKWIEAQPLARITAEKVRSFLWKNIICRYGIPREIISDNGRQFTDQNLALFLQNFNIKHHFSSVEHPQTNGQVESANRVVLQALKKKLDDAKGEWADLVPEVLWGYNTTTHSATGETPFKLVYGAEALIPVEVGTPTLRTELYNRTRNSEERATDLDLLEEEREIATIKQQAMKQFLQKRHNRRVVPRIFESGELVLRKTEEARKPKAHGKLTANWEGPFRINKVLSKGAYQLETLSREPVSGNWNISSLRKYLS
ncbi:uncharacterized protein LOC107606929 [Arachis ipaensis]|uniref:uncharacterized protein LOC107606929 n=1 Tax=Arachis ipaensis TaxID=130454 RepID=UPI0007AFB7A2|nr:uncharacterized protein LOC107606929 [Arachis ipaensis]XP_025664652.1 uncharacterized protein LOC112763114 [Arachis hypogaea]